METHFVERAGRVSETRFSLLEQRVGGMETSVNNLTTKLDVWMASKSQSAWKIVGFIAAVLIPLAFVVNMYITAAISPWAAIANQAKATADANTATSSRNSEDMGVVKSQNAASIQDRFDKGIVIAKLVEVTAELSRSIAANNSERQANEREVETQIDSTAQALNVQFANQQRENANFQNALHDLKAIVPVAPAGPFYFPNMSNRNHRKQ